MASKFYKEFFDAILINFIEQSTYNMTINIVGRNGEV